MHARDRPRAMPSRGLKLYGEYTFEVVEAEPVCKAGKSWTMTREQAVDWEETRQRFLQSGIDLGQIKIRPKSVWR